MSTISDLLAKLGLDSSEYNKGLDDAEGKASSFNAGIAGMSAVGGAALLGIGAAATAAAIGLGVATSAAMEAQDAMVILDSVIANTGDTSGVTSDMVTDLASSFQKTTKFEDEMTIGAGAVLARFDTINSETFPQALGLSLDLATAMGTDASSAAMTLGKALADPGVGLLRLKQAGAVFTEEQEKMIDTMMKAGDTAGAQAIILGVVEESIGGVAEAAGQTASGRLAIMKNTFGEILETIGGGLLDGLGDTADMIAGIMEDPATIEFVQGLASAIGDFASTVVSYLPEAIQTVKNLFGWLMDNKGVIVAALAIIGASILAFVYTTIIPAAIAATTALWPVILIMAAVGLAAYLLYEAWTNNWGGIQEKMAAVWAWLEPILTQFWNWLQVNIPIAIAWLVQMWQTVLLPAIMAAWAWIQANLFPLLQTLWTWLATNVPIAIQVLVAYFTVMWNFIATYILPLLQALGNFLITLGSVILTALAGFWQKVLLPALTAVWAFLNTYIFPVFKRLGAWLSDTFSPVLKVVADFLKGELFKAFDGIKLAIQWVIDKLKTLTNALKNIKLPSWLTPGSPTPFEMGLRGIADAMDDVNKARMNDVTIGTSSYGVDAARNVSAAPMTLVYSPTLSTASGDELQRQLLPFIEQGMRVIRPNG